MKTKSTELKDRVKNITPKLAIAKHDRYFLDAFVMHHEVIEHKNERLRIIIDSQKDYIVYLQNINKKHTIFTPAIKEADCPLNKGKTCVYDEWFCRVYCFHKKAAVKPAKAKEKK
jgi:3-phenylpropionate/cinnamic acid dioxygenase small subunit